MLNNRLCAGLGAGRDAWAIRHSTCSRMNQYRPLLPLRPTDPYGITMSKSKVDLMMISRTYVESIVRSFE